MKPAFKSKQYLNFVHEKEKVLEDILKKYHSLFTRIVAYTQETVISIANNLNKEQTDVFDDNLKQKINRIFALAAEITYHYLLQMRTTIYVFSNVSEVEALSRIEQKTKKVNLTHDIVYNNTVKNEDLLSEKKIKLIFMKLADKVSQSIATSIALNENKDEMIDRILKAYPKKKKFALARKYLKKFVESKKKKSDFLITGVVDRGTWGQVLQDYYADVIAPQITIGRESGTKKEYIIGKDEYYNWELESEINHDFVTLVRKGAIDAARENGIKDLMWIAVLDDKTDSCCRKRDGLTTSEIESKLKKEWKKDECRAVTPPAHFNCRCTMAPMTDETFEGPKNIEEELDTWLDEVAEKL